MAATDLTGAGVGAVTTGCGFGAACFGAFGVSTFGAGAVLKACPEDDGDEGGAKGGGGGAGRFAVLTSFTVGTLATGLVFGVGAGYGSGFKVGAFSTGFSTSDFSAVFFEDGLGNGCSGGGNRRSGPRPLSWPSTPADFCMRS